jgi:hypothetical protein
MNSEHLCVIEILNRLKENQIRNEHFVVHNSFSSRICLVSQLLSCRIRLDP